MRSSSLFTTLALTLALGLPALAEEAPAPQSMRGHRSEQMEARMAKHLQLTESQKSAIGALRAKRMPELQTRHKAMEAAREAFRTAEARPESKPEELKALHRTYSDLAFDLKLEHRALRKDIGALLTPEQRVKAAYMMGRMEGRHEGHRTHEGDFRHEGGGDGR